MKEAEGEKQRSIGGRGFWIALAAGVAAGAAVALLYAPSKGSEMRRRIGDAAAEGVNRAADAAEYGLTVYGGPAHKYGFQVQRFWKAVAAGIEESRRVRNELLAERGKPL